MKICINSQLNLINIAKIHETTWPMNKYFWQLFQAVFDAQGIQNKY